MKTKKQLEIKLKQLEKEMKTDVDRFFGQVGKDKCMARHINAIDILKWALKEDAKPKKPTGSQSQ